MTEQLKKVFVTKFLSVCLASIILLSACNTLPTPTSLPTSLPGPSATSEPLVTVTPEELVETATPEATMEPTMENAMEFSIDLNNLADSYYSEIIPAVSANENPPYWLLMPEYTEITLEGYPVNQHRMEAKIYIYPVAELMATNEGAGKVIDTLRTLIQDPQEIKDMPFLPLMNEVQVMHTQIQYLDFKTGQGLRYLTEFGQGIVPLNNYELFYTYQGLTNDGKYYVAAILPVNHPSLPADVKLSGDEPVEFSTDFSGYVKNVVNALNTQSASTFTPDLTLLDAMISSLEIK